MGRSVFISGIDTDAGKTYCAGWYAARLMEQGHRVITMKLIQTGCVGRSEDIEAHRKIMGVPAAPEDIEGLTAPVILSYPASAQLAARIEGCEIDMAAIDRARQELERRYDIVLVEGAGGLMVPVTDDFFTIDYAASRSLPVVLVTNSRLGSINHTVLSLEAIKARGLKLECVLYNAFFDASPEIAEDTRGFVERYVHKHFPAVPIIDVPAIGIDAGVTRYK